MSAVDKTEPFNPNNPKHIKAIERFVKKMRKEYKNAPEGLLIPKDVWDEIKALHEKK